MRFTILFLFLSSLLYGQVDQSPAMLVSSLSVISSSAPNYTVQGSFSSQFGYTRDSIQEGVDVLWLNYTISNPDRPIRALIDSFTVISGNTLRFYVELLDGETVLAFPTGTASIYRPTTNYGLALTEPNESNTTKEQKFNANMIAIDAAIAAAGGTVEYIDCTSSPITYPLPNANTVRNGTEYIIIKTDASENLLTVTADAFMDGSTDFVMYGENTLRRFVSNGATWSYSF